MVTVRVSDEREKRLFAAVCISQEGTKFCNLQNMPTIVVAVPRIYSTAKLRPF